MPKTGVFSETAFDEALKLGVKTDPHNPFEGFVNVHSEKGEVELEFDGVDEKYIVQQNGTILVTPEQGDEKFLLAGILSNNSRVLRQLRGLDKREPDDFRWAVEELSHAQKYSSILEILKTRLEDFIEKQELSKKNIRELQPLVAQQVTLETKIEKMDKDIKELSGKLSDTRFEENKLNEELKEALGKINRLKDALQKKEIERTRRTTTELAPKLNEIERWEAQRKRVDLKLKQTKEEIEALTGKEKRKSEIEKEVNNLLTQRNTVDGMLNLYLMAETNIHEKRSGKLVCPLCKVGSVTYKEIIQSISDSRKQRESLNSEILKLNQEKQTMLIQLTKAQEQEKSLRVTYRELVDRIDIIKKQLATPQDEIRQIESLIEDYREKLASTQKEYDSLNKKMSARMDSALGREFDEKNVVRSRTHEELGRIRLRISQLSVIEIFGRVFEPEVAESICNEIIKVLKDRVEFLEKRAEEEREQAASKFNENVNLLLSRLNFQEFRTVRLTGSPHYRLYVERYDPKKKDYKSQEIGTLSTSEKLAISIILQVALKETYLKNLPFMVIDDVLEDFDVERRTKVMEYLKGKVEKEGWFIVVTNLVKEVGPPRVEYL